MYVVPKKGLVVVDPGSHTILPESGANVDSRFGYHWERQQSFGDVEVFEAYEEYLAARAIEESQTVEPEEVPDLAVAQESVSAPVVSEEE